MVYTLGIKESRMPWRERKPMVERLRFIDHLLKGKKMAVACRQFGIFLGHFLVASNLSRT